MFSAEGSLAVRAPVRGRRGARDWLGRVRLPCGGYPPLAAVRLPLRTLATAKMPPRRMLGTVVVLLPGVRIPSYKRGTAKN
jgi:hypothetical protein